MQVTVIQSGDTVTIGSSVDTVVVSSSTESVTVASDPFGTIQVQSVIVDNPPYTGSYEVTPSGSEQTLNTRGMMMTDNVTIAPIPSNYGLVTWNGSTLTVS